MVYVIIVTYNGSKWIRKCLKSLQNSSIVVHILVVDNNSTDDTLEIVKEFSSVEIFKSSENVGFGKANNLGIQHALSKGAGYFFLMNQDTWIDSNCIEVLVNAIKKHPEFLIVSPLHLDGTGKHLDYKFSYYASPFYTDNLMSDLIINKTQLQEVYETKFVNAAFWLLSRYTIERVGLFDTLFPHYGEDSDYANRVLFHNYKIGISPFVYGFHDRPQRGFEIEDANYKKRKNRKQIFYLISLMNINNSLLRNYLFVFVQIAKNSFLSALQLKPKQVFVEAAVLTKLMYLLPKVHVKRKTNKRIHLK